jgi:metal-responsive CopG/Arc/MetJ family transcriptional regulator
MRTTVNLDDDVAAAVERLRRERGVGLSEAVNDLARRGLAAVPRARRFEQRTADVGIRIDVTDIGAVLEALDGPEAR